MGEQTTTTDAPTGKAEDLIAAVGDYSDDQLAALLTTEQEAEKPRSTVIEAVEAEQQRREDELKAKEAEQPRYTIEELLENARHFTGYSRHILAGALLGKTGKFTAAQAKKAAKAFAERKVETS